MAQFERISRQDFKDFQCKLACLIQEGIDGAIDFSSVVDVLTEILNAVQGQTESVDPIRFCDEDCNFTGAVAWYRPEDSAEPITPIFFDADMQITDVAPEGTPCDEKCGPDDYEYKWIEKCKKDADGNEIVQLTCIPIVNGEQGEAVTTWILADGSVSAEEPEGCTPCDLCDPKMVSFLGNDAPEGCIFDEFSLSIPPCCGVKVVTSAGEYIYDPMKYNRSVCEKFECFLSDYEILPLEGSDEECVNNIRTYLKKSK